MAVLFCIRETGWLSSCVLGRVYGFPILYMRKKVAVMLGLGKRVSVILIPGKSTVVSCAVYEEKGGCNQVSWGEYRAVPH